MMNFNFPSNNNVTQDQLNSQQQEELEGKNILDQLQNKTLNCQNITNDQYDLLGEYLMGQSVGNIQSHIVVDERIKSMMGENGETQLHINWGKTGSGCFNGNTSTSMMGFIPMNLRTNSFGGFGVLNWILISTIIVLGGILLFKQIRRK